MKTASKFKLRQHFREVRAHVPVNEREEAAKSAALIFAAQDFFKSSNTIACYLPIKDEFNSLPVIETIWHAKKNCYLPVLTEENHLCFVRYEYGDKLHRNRYGILEPTDLTHLLAADALDLVLTPLLAFDHAGHRLGTGGGYYDRTFAFLKQDSLQKPLMIGLAYGVQETAQLPFDPWDIALQGVITEKKFINCHR